MKQLEMSVLGLAFAAGLAMAPGAPADELHLSKGVIEGRIIEETKHFVRLETASGVLTVPTNVVTRRVRGVSRLERYALEREGEPLTTRRHIELAIWCGETGLKSLAREHIDAALASDPLSSEALQLAGYVQLGEVWLLADPAASAEPGDKRARSDSMVAQIAAGWHRRIRVLYENNLAGRVDPRAFAIGRDQLLAPRAPLAIRPACLGPSEGDPAARGLLAEFLGSFEEDAATINLLALALIDPAREVRAQATAQLARRPDHRISLFLQRALHCSAETILTRAANSLGWQRDPAAVEELIAVLPTSGSTGPRASAADVFTELIKTFPNPTVAAVADPPVEVPPAVEFADIRKKISVLDAEAAQLAGTFRTDVQDALINITGENFGFDVAGWRDWLAKNPPIGRGYP